MAGVDKCEDDKKEGTLTNLMETMKYQYTSPYDMPLSASGTVDEFQPIFSWPSGFTDHKVALDGSTESTRSENMLPDPAPDVNEIVTKVNLDDWSRTIELRPLPPFTGYTANLKINGIPGRHYHTISQSVPEGESSYCDNNIVSSSTCNIGSDSGDEMTRLNFECIPNESPIQYEVFSQKCEYETTSIDYLVEDLMGADMADTTVPNVNNNNNSVSNNNIIGNSNNIECGNRNESDEWMDLGEIWGPSDAQKMSPLNQDGMQDLLELSAANNYTKPQDNPDYGASKVQSMSSGPTLQNLPTHDSMPLLQYRLQNGPPIKQESPTSSNYNNLIPALSPPSTCGSTTDNMMQFLPHYPVQIMRNNSRKRSPDLMGHNLPHTSSSSPTKRPRARAQKKPQPQPNNPVFSNEQALGLGKEKQMHYCNICNRGFLNKSNIKVHLRTHTGEKPFSCETCSKAFRQKAHLLKHQQIHKRLGRD
ncbi:hypothetical protein HUJ05_003925 [Dendroctonus ponderosae]|nr:hypothetical protein HUJ05_003925 [Dendroctonus ponderosae]